MAHAWMHVAAAIVLGTTVTIGVSGGVAQLLLRTFRKKADSTTGLRRDIGDELDIIIGIDELENIHLELVGGAFFPRKAFDENDTTDLAAFKITVGF